MLKSKGDAFIEHIQKHLEGFEHESEPKVICKICDKDVDTIYKEYLENYATHGKPKGLGIGIGGDEAESG